MDAADRGKYDEVMKKFDEHCSPKKNETYERYVFCSCTQSKGERFDSFLTDLKLKSKTCNFRILTVSMIRDQIIFGIYDKKIRERLLRETELTLDGASPAELLMNRKIRMTLPFRMNTKRDKMSSATVRQKQKALQKRQKTNYDKQTLKVLSKNDIVRVEDANCWDRKDVVLEEINPRSHVVRTENGQILRRNRRSLLKDTRNKQNTAWQERRRNSGLTWRTSTTKQVFFAFFHTIG